MGDENIPSTYLDQLQGEHSFVKLSNLTGIQRANYTIQSNVWKTGYVDSLKAIFLSATESRIVDKPQITFDHHDSR